VLQLVDCIEAMREKGAAVVMASNDPRLLVHAKQEGWRHLALVGGAMVSGSMRSLFNQPNDDANHEDSKGHVLPFPSQADHA